MRSSVLLAMLLTGHYCVAETITVRVVDSQGHPLKKAEVTLLMMYGQEEPRPDKYDRNLRGETDAHGEVRFMLSEPPPVRLWAAVALDWRWHGCGAQAVTKDVIQKGIVEAPADRQKSPRPVAAQPGVFVLIARQLTFFEQLLYPLVKE